MKKLLLMDNNLNETKNPQKKPTSKSLELNNSDSCTNYTGSNVPLTDSENKKKISVFEIPTSYEIIGNIAHLNLREKFLPYKFLIGKIILDKNPSIKTVINKTDKIQNVFRTYNLEVLAGPENFLVTHREGNINFSFDIRTVYWCSRLQNERDRLLKVIKKGQVLCDAFCGVGPLALRAAKQGVKVYANDLNPSCFEYLKKNMLSNKIDKRLLIPFNTDAREFIRLCISQGKEENQSENNSALFPKGEVIQHFYMNLPKDAIEFLDAFRGAFNNSDLYNKDNLPIVHVYGFSNAENPKEDLLTRICKAFNIQTFPEEDLIEIINIRDVSTKKHMFSVSLKVPFQVAFEA